MNQLIETEREILNKVFDETTETISVSVLNNIKVDDSTPLDVNVTNSIKIDDSVPIKVDIDIPTISIDTTTPLNTRIVDKNNVLIDANNPFTVDGHQVFLKDLNLSLCTSNDFTGTVADLFTDLYSTIQNVSPLSLKTINIYFNRPYLCNGVSLLAQIGAFSNVKMYGLTSGGSAVLVADESTDNTPYNSRIYRFSVAGEALPVSIIGIIGVRIEFHTANPVFLSFVDIQKWNTNIAIIQGQTPRGNYVDFQATNKGNFKVALDEYQGDAFGRLKTSLPFTVFDNTMVYDTKNLFWSNLIVGGSSVQNRSLAKSVLSVNAGIGNYVLEQTKMRFKYQPGKALEVLMTGLLINELNVVKRIGLFDVDNGTTISTTPKKGIFFENNSGVWSWNIASNGGVTETAIQANWNVDKLDGNGLSGFTLNLNSTQIWFLDLEWLGVGTVRCGFVINGEIIVCHEFHHANKAFFTDVYMNNANLPVNYSILSNGGAGTMSHICTTVVSGGGFNPIGVSRSVSRETAATINTGKTSTSLGIRLKSDSYDATVLPITLDLLSLAKANSKVTLCMNPTYTGTSTWTALANSTIEFSESVLPVTNKGLVIYESFVSDNSNSFSQELENSLRLGKGLNGVFDELWIVIKSLDANDTYYTSLTFAELL